MDQSLSLQLSPLRRRQNLLLGSRLLQTSVRCLVSGEEEERRSRERKSKAEIERRREVVGCIMPKETRI